MIWRRYYCLKCEVFYWVRVHRFRRGCYHAQVVARDELGHRCQRAS